MYFKDCLWAVAAAVKKFFRKRKGGQICMTSDEVLFV